MMKKLTSILLLLTLLLSVCICANAAEKLVYDDADLLNQGEEQYLQSRLQEISNEFGAQVLVATVPEVADGDVDGYINQFYDSMNFGYGQNRDGVLLLVCMDPREYRILSNGFAADAITLGDIDSIGEAIVSDLSDGDYAAAFDEFAAQCVYYLDGHINGFPFNFGKNMLIALVVGLVVGLIVVLILKGQLKSVHRQNQADVYVRPGSMQLSVQRDLFLYRHVTRRKKPSSSSSGSRSGGGSRNVGGGSF